MGNKTQVAHPEKVAVRDLILNDFGTMNRKYHKNRQKIGKNEPVEQKPLVLLLFFI